MDRVGIFQAASHQLWTSIPFLMLFLVSFSWVGALSAAEALRLLFAPRAAAREAKAAGAN